MNRMRPHVPGSPEELATARAADDAMRAAVRAGLAELDAGIVVPEEDVWAWVDSWDTADERPPPTPRPPGQRR